jgi:hypothetical protein
VFVTSYPYAEYVRHAWGGALVNSLFHNESGWLSSDLITLAVAHTLTEWEPPDLGIVSFVDAGKIREGDTPGRRYLEAGWKHVGFTKGGLYAFQQLPGEMPEPKRLHHHDQLELFGPGDWVATRELAGAS